jgi:hypothetical protein
MWNMPLRLEIGKAGYFGREADGQSPMAVLPDLKALEFRIPVGAAANHAIGGGY